MDGIPVYAHGYGCPVLANEEATRRVDRAYFDEHPDTVSYVRRLMPGDLGVVSLECIMATADGLPPTVRITRIANGVRAVSIGGEGMPWVVNPLTLDGQRVAAFLAGGDR